MKQHSALSESSCNRGFYIRAICFDLFARHWHGACARAEPAWHLPRCYRYHRSRNVRVSTGTLPNGFTPSISATFWLGLPRHDPPSTQLLLAPSVEYVAVRPGALFGKEITAILARATTSLLWRGTTHPVAARGSELEGIPYQQLFAWANPGRGLSV